jgi:hypothetical protein
VVGRRRQLLLPEKLLLRLNSEQRATLLVHELAHLRRGDPWVRYLELVVLAFYWWCPLVWWARRELREAEEECCDAWVVWALPGLARSYALALVEAVDFMAGAAPVPVLASGLGQVQMLRRRLTMIMRGTTPKALTGRGTFAILVLGGILLPLLPGRAQETAAQIQQHESELARMAQLQNSIDTLRRQLEGGVAELDGKQDSVNALRRELDRFDDDQELPLEGVPGTVLQRQSARPPADKKDLERRLADLEQQIVEALRELRELRRSLGLPSPPVHQPKSPVYRMPNPRTPPELGSVMPLQAGAAIPPGIHGVIQKLDEKAGLAQISIGKKDGAKESDTLDVYRLKPQPEYLGTIQLVEVREDASMGRPKRLSSSRIREGDEVISALRVFNSRAH